MAIQVENASSTPNLVYDKVHLVGMNIVQPKQTLDSSSPVYHIMIQYQMYAVDLQGIRHYKPEQLEIEINNYLEFAMNEYTGGDPTFIVAFQSIETAVAALIERDRGANAEVVS